MQHQCTGSVLPPLTCSLTAKCVSEQDTFSHTNTHITRSGVVDVNWTKVHAKARAVLDTNGDG